MADWKEALEELENGYEPAGVATDYAASIIAHIEELEAQLSEARDTNRRLNRRVQEAEAAIPSYRKLVAEPPNGDGVRFVNGNMGRALLAHYCNQATERAEAAERDARELLAESRKLALSHLGLLTIYGMTDGVEQTRAHIAAIDAAIATTEQDHD